MSKAWRRSIPSLRSWKLRNFKSVVKADLPLAPLTLVVGANSAGKSSLLQSILLMAQASEEVAPGPGSFPLNGPLVGLGAFIEARSDFEESSDEPIIVGGSLVLPELIRRYHFLTPRLISRRHGLDDNAATETDMETLVWDINLWKDQESSGAVVRSSEVKLSRGLTLLGELLAYARPDDEAAPAMVSRYQVWYSDRYKMKESLADDFYDERSPRARPKRVRARLAVDREFGAVAFRAGVPVGGLTEMKYAELFLDSVEEYARNFGPPQRQTPDEISEESIGQRSSTDVQKAVDRLYSLLEERFGVFAAELLNGDPPDIDFYREFAADCHKLMRRRDYSEGVRPALVERLTSGLSESHTILAEAHEEGMTDSSSFIPQYFKDWVLYLGPLREDPRVTYPHAIAGSTHMPLGRKGESTASVLLQSTARGLRSTIGAERYPLPNDSGTPSLQESVRAWVKKFGLGESIYVSDKDRYGVGFTIDKRDLTSVGTGVSQILPVIVLCLMAQPGQLVLLEQPELHLNPALQQHLADFFLAMVRSGRQLIVETHSEYVVTRLRRRVAEDERDEVRNLFNIVFASQDENHQTNFDVFDVDESGALGIEEWPPGFFDQAGSDVDAMMRLALGKRRQNAGG